MNKIFLCARINILKGRNSMANITIYQKPTCTTCRQVYSALKEAGADFNAVDYYVNPIPKSKLKD